jgi:hypothetical protein
MRQEHRPARSYRPNKLDYGRFVRPRRDADRGRAGGGKRLRDLLRETKMHRRQRALEQALARGAIEIGLRGAGGKMQHAVERTLP